MTQPTVFISYSHKDEEEKQALISHLGVLASEGLVDVWVDDQISGGDDWEQEINQMMAKAKVAILIITANFLTSNFIGKKEIPKLLNRRQNEGLVILPVIARACAWETVDWLRQMNVRPKNGRPVWSDRGSHVDDNLATLAREVARIINTQIDQVSDFQSPPGTINTNSISFRLSDNQPTVGLFTLL